MPNRGFTLIEVLVALIIFGIITVALSFTFDTAMQTQIANTRRLEELGAVRAVFDYMTRDMQQAYASSTNQAAVFIAGENGQGSTSTGVSTGLLTLMTRGNRLVTDLPSSTGATTGPAATSAAPPQSDTAMVRYDFDAHAMTLSRTVVPVPSLDALQQATTGPDNVICGMIKEITIQFWDPTNQNWRSDWDYEQQVQAAANGTQGTTGATGAAGAAAQPAANSTTNTGNGDTTLPSQVQISVTIQHNDSTTATYTATIPVVTSQVADGTAPPTNMTTTSTTTGAAQ